MSAAALVSRVKVSRSGHTKVTPAADFSCCRARRRAAPNGGNRLSFQHVAPGTDRRRCSGRELALLTTTRLTMISLRTRLIATVVLALGAFLTLYHHVVEKLIHDWATDDNYSHGFLIVPLAAYLIWERRDKLQALELRPTNAGLAVAIASLGVLVAGTLGAELFLTRISMLGFFGGAILFLGGRQHLRVLLVPLLFLLLMIPIPAIIFARIAFPLQLLARTLTLQFPNAQQLKRRNLGQVQRIAHLDPSASRVNRHVMADAEIAHGMSGQQRNQEGQQKSDFLIHS